MSTILQRIPLILRDTGAEVEAELRDRIEESNLDDWQKKWKPIIDATTQHQHAAQKELPAGWHWNWRKKMEAVRGLLSESSFCIECEGVTQGMMAVSTAKQRAWIEEQKGQHLVYVDYLEAAPWNRKELSAKPRFHGVGSTLIIAAIALSRANEFKGRIGLHSLPQAHQFYTDRCGMTDLGPDPKYQNLRYFEMTPDQATKFLERKE